MRLFLPLLTALPIFLGLLLCGAAFWLCSGRARARGITVAERMRILRRLRALVTLLPLSGLLGTMASLMNTLAFMGRQAENLNEQMGEVLSRFAPALSSTLYGVLFAMIAIGVIEYSLHVLEGSDVQK